MTKIKNVRQRYRNAFLINIHFIIQKIMIVNHVAH